MLLVYGVLLLASKIVKLKSVMCIKLFYCTHDFCTK